MDKAKPSKTFNQLLIEFPRRSLRINLPKLEKTPTKKPTKRKNPNGKSLIKKTAKNLKIEKKITTKIRNADVNSYPPFYPEEELFEEKEKPKKRIAKFDKGKKTMFKVQNYTTEEYHNWDSKKKRLWDRIGEDPDGFYHFYCPPGEVENKNHYWNKAERESFLKKIKHFPVKDNRWGLFSMRILGRNGKQCKRFYKKCLKTNTKSPKKRSETVKNTEEKTTKHIQKRPKKSLKRKLSKFEIHFDPIETTENSKERLKIDKKEFTISKRFYICFIKLKSEKTVLRIYKGEKPLQILYSLETFKSPLKTVQISSKNPFLIEAIRFILTIYPFTKLLSNLKTAFGLNSNPTRKHKIELKPTRKTTRKITKRGNLFENNLKTNFTSQKSRFNTIKNVRKSVSTEYLANSLNVEIRSFSSKVKEPVINEAKKAIASKRDLEFRREENKKLKDRKVDEKKDSMKTEKDAKAMLVEKMVKRVDKKRVKDQLKNFGGEKLLNLIRLFVFESLEIESLLQQEKVFHLHSKEEVSDYLHNENLSPEETVVRNEVFSQTCEMIYFGS